MPIRRFLHKFVAKYRTVAQRNTNLPHVAEPPARKTADPLHDKTPTNKRMTMEVDPLHHGLHLSLPPAPAKSHGEPGFAVIHVHGDPAMHGRITGELSKHYHTGRIAAREWHNAHGEEAVAPGHGEGKYVSLRGDADLVRSVVQRARADHKVAHASENVLA